MSKKNSSKITLNCIDRDKNVRIYSIKYEETEFQIQFYQRKSKGVLYLESVDLEGMGKNMIGSKLKRIINDVAYEFCKKHNVNKIVISGSRRSAGRTKGKFLSTIKLKFDNIV